MSIEISSINNAKLRKIAMRVDNGDGKLKRDEYPVFTKEAEKEGVDYKEIYEALNMNGLLRWWYDVDKVSKDGNDDGHLSFGESALSFAKGLGGGLIKGILKNPLKSLAGVGAVVGLSTLTGGAILPLLTVAGVAIGTGMVVAGSIQNAKADNDGDAKRGLETAGSGFAAAIFSFLGVKSANRIAAKGGVKGLAGIENKNILTNFIRALQTLPEQFKVASMNAKGNIMTWGTGILHANSNRARTGLRYSVQNSEIEAYKVDLNGTVDEVLAKNSGLSYDQTTGQYYVQTSWGEKSIISSENYMIARHSSGGLNAIDEAGFRAYQDNVTGEIIDITSLKPGEIIKAAKVNDQVIYKIAKPGTKYMSAEGVHELQPGSIIQFDDLGRPYQSTIKFMFENVELNNEQMIELANIDIMQAAQTPAGRNIIFANKALKEKLFSTSDIINIKP